MPGPLPKAQKLVPMGRPCTKLLRKIEMDRVGGRPIDHLCWRAPRQGCLFRPLPDSQRGAGPSHSALVSDISGPVLSAGICILWDCFQKKWPIHWPNSLKRERGGGLFCLLQIFFKAGIDPMAIFCGTLASNIYQESLCLHEMTIWYCIWYKTIFLLPGFTLQHIVYYTTEWFWGLSHGNWRHSPKPT